MHQTIGRESGKQQKAAFGLIVRQGRAVSEALMIVKCGNEIAWGIRMERMCTVQDTNRRQSDPSYVSTPSQQAVFSIAFRYSN